MGKGSAPAPPDPVQTAAAQTGTNVSTAIANANLNNVNQVTPQGTLTYTQTGTHEFTDPTTGKTFDIPQYTATTEFTPEQQAIFDQAQGAQLGLAKTANTQANFLNDYLGEPIQLGNEEVESRLFELGRNRLDPVFDERRAAMETKLANQGLMPGTEAYDRAMRDVGQMENDAYNQLLLSGRSQSIQEQLAQRNQPINEITALLGGSQVSQPMFQNTPQYQIPTTDYAGLVNSSYNQRLQGWQTEQQQQSDMMGGLFSAAAMLGAAAIMSDRRLKTDIEPLGEIDGIPIYRYRYKDGGPVQIGVMAQDMQQLRPEAVIEMPNGMLAVDYSKVF